MIVYPLVLLFFARAVSADFELCVDQSVDYPTCTCFTTTDSQTQLPISVANCEHLNLQDIPDTNSLRADLEHLYLSHNNITQLEETTHRFGSLNLKKLILSYNRIDYISEEFFDDTPNLTDLDLSHNVISNFESPDVFLSLTKLEVLDLSFNNIKTLPDSLLQPQLRLRKLNLSYNYLGKWLMEDSLVLFNLGVSTNLTHLGLENLGLTDLPNTFFDNYTNLNLLLLGDNDLDVIPNLPNGLTYLDISGLNLTELHAKHLNYPALRVLKLNHLKKLTTIHKYAFYNLLHLEELSITDCGKLEEINECAFGVLQKSTVLPLKKLHLSRNGLKRMNYTFGYLFDRLELIDLRNNRWDCDCDLFWLKEYEYTLYRKDSISCSSPQQLRGKLLKQLDDSHLPNCFPEKSVQTAHRIIIPALIALIIILSGLIAYLIYFAPKWYSSRGVGPYSPYSPTSSTED